jgi:hypothetical protein
LKKLLGVLLFSLSFASIAQILEVGSPLPNIQFNDQHDQAIVVAADLHIILFAGEKAMSELMTKSLETLPPTSLKDKKAIYIADISGMPSFITKMVALPRMQKMPYQIALIREDKDALFLPKKAGHITAVKLSAGKVASVEYLNEMNQILQVLK